MKSAKTTRNISNPIISSKLIFSPPFHYSLFRKTMKSGLTAYRIVTASVIDMRPLKSDLIV